MRAFLFVILVFLILPTTSLAQSSARFRNAAKIAEQIYGPVCHGDVRYVEQSLPGSQVGEADWMIHGASGNNPMDFYDCKIIVNYNHHYSRSMYCAIIVHEWGHLAGLEHSPNPHSVMCERLTKSSVPFRCK